MARRTSVRQEKLKQVDELAHQITKSKVAGIIDANKLPSKALQKIKNRLRGKASIRFTRKSILLLALEKSGEKAKLKEFIGNQPALILTDMDPFMLYKQLKKSKTPAPAKGGDIAPMDIVVQAGPTEIMPGPAMSALQKLGIKTKVEGGKIAVASDSTVAKAGATISLDLAGALQMLKVLPMEVGLNLTVAFEGGMLYKRDVLDIDEHKVLADIMLASQNAFNLAFNSSYPTKQTLPLMITKAFMNAKSLGLEANILDKGVIEDLLARAKLQADALQSKVGSQS